ncbi:MAG: 4-hydroxy-tetrahydrodipicolinate reductase [Gammaproteobacteria bacterium]|nr:4-hydroxy-tetrahydrodipicolinate reductase [Gammaproteobacteria bacterium]
MSAAPVAAVLVGASGRMGRALREAANPARLRWVGAIVSPDSRALGTEFVPGLRHSSDLAAVLPDAQVVLDFSRAEAIATTLAACRGARRALLLGTTGYEASLERDFIAAARDIPLLIAPNTSLGVAVFLELAASAARSLPGHALAVREVHHAGKRDAPSGTARALAAALRQVRPGAEVPIESVRAGEAAGEHRLRLAGPDETLELTHRALDRGLFARGAVTAALWLASQPPGRYGMRDVLFGKTAG